MNWLNNQTKQEQIIQNEFLEQINLPKHIAIIMDGNGRWAEGQEMPRVSGHREGIESVREIIRNCSNLGVDFLTLYAFSIENWNRPTAEVNALMTLLEIFLNKELAELNGNNVIIKTIGKTSALTKKVQKLLHKAIEKTKDNTGMTLVLALSYSGRWDIVRAVQMISLDIRRGKLSPEDINDELFGKKLQTAEMPDPDLLIRTSGEMRISNFLLWELAYSEIYVSHKLWPEFRINDLYCAIESYSNRERRFGKTSKQIAVEKEISESINKSINKSINEINQINNISNLDTSFSSDLEINLINNSEVENNQFEEGLVLLVTQESYSNELHNQNKSKSTFDKNKDKRFNQKNINAYNKNYTNLNSNSENSKNKNYFEKFLEIFKSK